MVRYRWVFRQDGRHLRLSDSGRLAHRLSPLQVVQTGESTSRSDNVQRGKRGFGMITVYEQ
jgi:hypothetical protein